MPVGAFIPVGYVKGNMAILLPNKYEMPTTPERVTANILYYTLNNKYLDNEIWVRTSDSDDDEDWVYLQTYPDMGIYIGTHFRSGINKTGVSASRKLDTATIRGG